MYSTTNIPSYNLLQLITVDYHYRILYPECGKEDHVEMTPLSHIESYLQNTPNMSSASKQNNHNIAVNFAQWKGQRCVFLSHLGNTEHATNWP